MERRGIAAAVGVVATMMVSVGTLRSAGGGHVPSVHSESVRAATFGARPTFLIRRAGTVTVFLTDVQHLAGEDTLWWCPSERLFVSPTHGELFDAGGRVVGGPARAGLDRLGAVLVDGRLVVDEHQIIPGSARPVPLTDLLPGAGRWDRGPSSFCAGAVRSDS